MTNAEQGHGHIDASVVWQAIGLLQREFGLLEGKMDALDAGQRDLAQRTETSIDRLEQRIEANQRELSQRMETGQRELAQRVETRIDRLEQRIDRLTITFIGSSAVLAAAMIGAIFGSRFIG